MSTEELRKAVEYLRLHEDGCTCDLCGAHDLIRQALRDQEAEIDRLTAAWDSAYKQAMQNGESTQVQRDRAEKAEALLRECLTAMELHPATHDRITAHLSENSRD